MTRSLQIAMAAAVCFGLIATSVPASAQHRLGAGLHYLRNLGDITDTPVDSLDFSQDSFGIVGSYQYDGGIAKLEADLEYIFDHVGTGEAMWEPSIWGLVGTMLYGGIGMGIGYTDGEWQQNPFYALRAGTNLSFATFGLDLFATYRFQSNEDLENLTGEDLDSITFAALVRFGL